MSSHSHCEEISIFSAFLYSKNEEQVAAWLWGYGILKRRQCEPLSVSALVPSWISRYLLDVLVQAGILPSLCLFAPAPKAVDLDTWLVQVPPTL